MLIHNDIINTYQENVPFGWPEVNRKSKTKLNIKISMIIGNINRSCPVLSIKIKVRCWIKI